MLTDDVEAAGRRMADGHRLDVRRGRRDRVGEGLGLEAEGLDAHAVGRAAEGALHGCAAARRQGLKLVHEKRGLDAERHLEGLGALGDGALVVDDAGEDDAYEFAGLVAGGAEGDPVGAEAVPAEGAGVDDRRLELVVHGVDRAVVGLEVALEGEHHAARRAVGEVLPVHLDEGSDAGLVGRQGHHFGSHELTRARSRPVGVGRAADEGRG